MGIKCSLLGHRYGEPAVDREREEQGSEVVITITEIETCQRCGHSRVVSENKEVTTTERPEPESADDAPADDAPADEAAGEDELEAENGADAESEGLEIPDAEGGAVVPDLEAEEPVDPAEDDGVILDDEGPEREPGKWPEDEGEAVAEEPAEAAPEWPEAEDRDDDPATGTVGEWPDEPEDEGSDLNLIDAVDDGPDREVEPARSSTITVPEGDFRCPECGYTTAVEASSLRAGDFCPECHRGTLVHET